MAEQAAVEKSVITSCSLITVMYFGDSYGFESDGAAWPARSTKEHK